MAEVRRFFRDVGDWVLGDWDVGDCKMLLKMPTVLAFFKNCVFLELYGFQYFSNPTKTAPLRVLIYGTQNARTALPMFLANGRDNPNKQLVNLAKRAHRGSDRCKTSTSANQCSLNTSGIRCAIAEAAHLWNFAIAAMIANTGFSAFFPSASWKVDIDACHSDSPFSTATRVLIL